MKEYLEALERIKFLEQELSFYASYENNKHKIDFTVGRWELLSLVAKDEGERARKALSIK